MSAMHHDTSPDLNVVGSKLKDVFDVRFLYTCFSFSYLLLKLKRDIFNHLRKNNSTFSLYFTFND